MKYFIVTIFLLFVTPAFACTATIGISQTSPDFAAANSVAENVMAAFKASHIVQLNSSKSTTGDALLFCFIATSSNYVELVRSHLKGVMSSYSGVSVSAGDSFTNTLTCRSSEVRQAIHSCFDRRPNCPLSSYCSWAYSWYERCSTTRPNRYCF